MRIFPRPYSSAGLRAVFEEQAPKAEEMAARYVEHTRPVWSWMASEWRRLGTVAALVLILGVVLHAMFGANGMVVYQQKRAERQTLQGEVQRLQKENDRVRGADQGSENRSIAPSKERRANNFTTRVRGSMSMLRRIRRRSRRLAGRKMRSRTGPVLACGCSGL